jgi:hypothetical protein
MLNAFAKSLMAQGSTNSPARIRVMLSVASSTMAVGQHRITIGAQLTR